MKKKVFILLILIILFIIFVLINYFVFEKKNNFGQLRIVSSPTTSVFINNLAVGKTPFYEKYPVGDYILKLIPEGVATETASWQGKINVYKNALTYVNRELGSSDALSAGEILTITKMEERPKKPNQGEIYIETEPQGAIIYLDNDEKGVAPLILGEVTGGDHELSVFLPGFRRRTLKINVEVGFRLNAFFKLAIDDEAKKIIDQNQKKENSESTNEAQLEKKQKIVINDTPTGWLRVREEPSINASEAARVNPGDEFVLLEEKDGWYKIEYEKEKFGWVSSQYTTKK